MKRYIYLIRCDVRQLTRTATSYSISAVDLKRNTFARLVDFLPLSARLRTWHLFGEDEKRMLCVLLAGIIIWTPAANSAPDEKRMPCVLLAGSAHGIRFSSSLQGGATAGRQTRLLRVENRYAYNIR
jgi:hypothetical protein